MHSLDVLYLLAFMWHCCFQTSGSARWRGQPDAACAPLLCCLCGGRSTNNELLSCDAFAAGFRACERYKVRQHADQHNIRMAQGADSQLTGPPDAATSCNTCYSKTAKRHPLF